MNLVLIGYRGTGKSTVAALLARSLDREVLGMDAEIIIRANCSIPQFVAAHGWPAFRDLETAVCRDFAARDDVIIDCGGGIIERPENIPLLKHRGTVFWLKSAPEAITRRLTGATDRPSLTGGKSFLEEISEVLTARTPRYRAAADRTVDIDGQTPAQVAEEILVAWQQLIAANDACRKS